MDLEKWLADWTACVDGIFGERIRFLGIQGSYGRGEATAESDIDVVLLLDGLQLEDLQAYDEAVSALPMREKMCIRDRGYAVVLPPVFSAGFLLCPKAVLSQQSESWHLRSFPIRFIKYFIQHQATGRRCKTSCLPVFCC